MADQITQIVGKDVKVEKTVVSSHNSSKISQKELDVSFLVSIGQKISGTVEEIHARAELFRQQPKLASQLEKNFLSQTAR